MRGRLALIGVAAPFVLIGLGMFAWAVVGSGRAGERLTLPLAGTVFLIVGSFILARAFPGVLGRFRDADSSAVRRLSRQAPALAMRVVVAILCFTPLLIATGAVPTVGEPPVPQWVGILGAGAFALAGAYVLLLEWIRTLLPGTRRRVEGVVVLLIVTCFAVIADWIGFGAGRRAFTSSFSGGVFGLSWLGSELVGRVMFGLSGVFLSVVTIVGWWRFLLGRGSEESPRSP